MIRKILAACIIFLWVLFITPLFFAQSILVTFLDLDYVRTEVVPASYQSVISLASTSLTTNELDQDLFKTRLEKALPPEYYQQLLSEIISSFNKNSYSVHDDRVTLDLSEGKKILITHVPAIIARLETCRSYENVENQFRVCIPESETMSTQQVQQMAVTLIEKEIPERVSPVVFAGNVNKDEVYRVTQSFSYMRSVLPAIMLVTTVLALGLAALVIFSSWQRVVKWLATAGIILALYNGFFIISLNQVPEVIPVFQNISPAFKDFIVFLLKVPLDLFTFWTALITAFCVILFGLTLIKKR